MFNLLGYKTDKTLYEKAFVHKSFDPKNNNEQLEFLGDAILSLIVAELLFIENPNLEEGFLSKKRATIVRRKHLNLVGKKIIPKKKIKTSLKNIPINIFGNTLEAIIGAIYLDKGIKQTRIFIKKNIYNSEFLTQLTDVDFKSKLLNYSQKEKIKLEYKIEDQYGLEHQKEFLVSVLLNGKKISESIAGTKREAEQGAAQKAINKNFSNE